MTQQRSFFELVRVHEELEELLIRHQEALVRLQRDRALKTFAIYAELLLLHIDHEDNILLPVFARKGRLKRWPPELYSGEHDKMKAMLRRYGQSLEALPQEPTPRLVIACIDEQGTLKRLHEHHDLREKENFFPVLDAVTDAEERTDLLAQTLTVWFETHARLHAED